MKVLAIGSNSCAGSHFVSHCLNEKIQVFATSRSPENSQTFLAYKKGACEYHQIDINTDLIKLKLLIQKYKPNVVINFASQSMVGESWENPQHWVRTNISSTLELYKLISEFSFIEKFIHFSTPEVYGNATNRIDENHSFNPSTPYAVTRAAGDEFGKIWAKNYKMPFIITRAGNVYGEAQRIYRIIPKTIYSSYHNLKIPLHGGGFTRRNFVHGDDISSGLIKIIEHGNNLETYHISSPEYISIKDLVLRIYEMTGKNQPESWVEAAQDRPGKDLDYSLGDEKLRQLGWSNKVSLDEGIKRVINWYNDQKNSFTSADLQYVHKQ